jgi:hypothetical protein
LSVFLRGIGAEDTPAAFDVALRASPASRKKSTMPASAAFCLPTSDRVMRAPRAAVVLFAPDMSEADSSKEGLLERRMRRSLGDDGRKRAEKKERVKKRGRDTHDM